MAVSTRGRARGAGGAPHHAGPPQGARPPVPRGPGRPPNPPPRGPVPGVPGHRQPPRAGGSPRSWGCHWPGSGGYSCRTQLIMLMARGADVLFSPPFILLSVFGWSGRAGAALGWDHMILSSRHFRKTLFIPGRAALGLKGNVLGPGPLPAPAPAAGPGALPPLPRFLLFYPFYSFSPPFFSLSPPSLPPSLPLRRGSAAISAGRRGLPKGG